MARNDYEVLSRRIMDVTKALDESRIRIALVSRLKSIAYECMLAASRAGIVSGFSEKMKLLKRSELADLE